MSFNEDEYLNAELQYCLTRLGQNDLDINNLAPQLREFEEQKHLVDEFAHELRELRNLAEHIHNFDHQNKQLIRLVEQIQVTISRAEDRIKRSEASDIDAYRKFSEIAMRNLEVFTSLHKLTSSK